MTIADDELASICKEWRERNCRTLDKVMAKSFPEVAKIIAEIFERDALAEPDGTTAELRILETLGTPPAAPLLTVVHLYAHALRHWQTSMADWPGQLLVALCAQLNPHVIGQEGAVFGAFGTYVGWLEAGYRAENGLNCSCPIQTRRTGQIVREAAAAFKFKLDSITVSDRDIEQIVEILRLDVEVHLGYFGALERVAVTVEGLVEGRPENNQLRDAINEVTSTVVALKGDSHQSNLRPQLAMLEALKHGRAKDWLRIESARVRYCFPFSMLMKQEGAEPAVVTITKESISEATRDSSWPSSWVSGPQRLSDLWRDTRDAKIYTIELPNVKVETLVEVLEFSCEIRMRKGGNHSLILTHRLQPRDVPGSVDADRALRSLHLLNQALRRATFNMGREKVHFEGENEDHRKIPELVMHSLSRLARGFHAEIVSTSDIPFAIDDFHIVVSQIESWVESRYREPRRALPEDLRKAVGASLLTREVRQMAATTVEEWLLQEPATCENLFERHGREGELALATANTTVLFMPNSPDWVILDEMEDMAEFVVAQKALYRMWHVQLQWQEGALENYSRDLRSSVEQKKKQPPDLVKMQSSILDLRHLQATIGAELARLHSLNVLKSGGYRDLHDALSKSASLPRLETDLQAKLSLLAEQHEQVAAMSAAIVERRRQDSSAIIEFVLGALAVFGVLSWVRDLFNHEGWGGFSGELVIALLATIALWGIRKRNRI